MRRPARPHGNPDAVGAHSVGGAPPEPDQVGGKGGAHWVTVTRTASVLVLAKELQMDHNRHRCWTVLLALIGMLLTVVALPGAPPVARASDTPDPSFVTIAGSFQSELGCPGNWQPECTATRLVYDATDQVWQATFTILPETGSTKPR